MEPKLSGTFASTASTLVAVVEILPNYTKCLLELDPRGSGRDIEQVRC
jgi:hypothetical protein